MKDQQTNFTQARLASLVRRAMDKVVAQVSNLLYRSASSLRMPRQTQRNGHGNVLPIGNRRYSRLETCVTPNWSDFVNRPGISLPWRHCQIAPLFMRAAEKTLDLITMGRSSIDLYANEVGAA